MRASSEHDASGRNKNVRTWAEPVCPRILLESIQKKHKSYMKHVLLQSHVSSIVQNFNRILKNLCDVTLTFLECY